MDKPAKPPSMLEKLRAKNTQPPPRIGGEEPLPFDPDSAESVSEARFKVESIGDNFMRITVTCARPPGAHALPDQESRGAMAMPRAVWFMTGIVRAFALQLGRPMVARAMETVITAAKKEVDKVAKAKAKHDAENGTDV